MTFAKVRYIWSVTPCITLDGPRDAKKRKKKPFEITFAKIRYSGCMTPCITLYGPREAKN